MNKFFKFFMFSATACLILVSCSKNEVTDINQQNPDVIGFSSTTSRAVINNLASLEADPSGFQVFGIANGGSNWYTDVDGTNNYKYITTSPMHWEWNGTDAIWPAVSGYPMTFYAMYPGNASITNDGTASPVEITDEITIAATAASQKDLLAAKATALSKPGDGRLPLNFKHILSKVNFAIIPGYEKIVTIQETGVQNVYSKAVYDYVGEAWDTPGTNADYDYYNNTATQSFTGTDGGETTAISFTSVSHLMLMPQTAHITWDPTGTLVPNTLAAGSYASMTYRLTTIPPSSDDEIGYTNAEDYEIDNPGYLASISWPGWSTYTALGSGAGGYNDALFIKAGFPLSAATFTWTPGKGYTYQIGLGTNGSCNGYYTATTYFDKDGNDTGIPIIGSNDAPVNIGDPVTDGIIHFKVTVTEWVDDSASPIDLP